MTRFADSVLDKVVPKATAKADQFECSWQYRCYLPYCFPSRVHLTRFKRQICAGTNGPSYSRWEKIGCCS